MAEYLEKRKEENVGTHGVVKSIQPIGSISSECTGGQNLPTVNRTVIKMMVQVHIGVQLQRRSGERFQEKPKTVSVGFLTEVKSTRHTISSTQCEYANASFEEIGVFLVCFNWGDQF